MRTVGFVTSARSDYGMYRPIFSCVSADPSLKLQIYAAGMHLSPEFGMTARDIEGDGFTIAERIELLLASDSPQGVAKAIGLGTISFAQAFARSRPDILVVLGDRFEMLSSVLAALPYNIPIAHIHGGESTEGAIDDAIRHSLTKFSHLHFVSTALYRARVVQLAEEPWRVVVSGAPSLDNLQSMELMSCSELEGQLGFGFNPAPLLVTFHPVTLEYEKVDEDLSALLAALDDTGQPVVFTYPNADTRHSAIVQGIDAYVTAHANARSYVSLGTRTYFSLMAHSAAMVGNSSSGIIEAASFGLPVVNIGSRQHGRLHGRNVINVAPIRGDIRRAILDALDPVFRQSLAGMTNPYGDGGAAARIVARLREVPLDRRLLAKRFHEVGLPIEGDLRVTGRHP